MTSPDPSSPSSSSSHNPFPTDSPAFDAAQQTYQPDSAFFQALMQKTSHYDLNKDEQKAVDRAWMTFRGGAAVGTLGGIGLGRVVTTRRELKGVRAFLAYGVLTSFGLIMGSLLSGQMALARLGKDLEGSELVEMVRKAVQEDRAKKGLGPDEFNPNWPFPKEMGPWPQGPPEGVKLYIPPPPGAPISEAKIGKEEEQGPGRPVGKTNKYGDRVD